jgi:NADH-quinone oxidoreductase subunit N
MILLEGGSINLQTLIGLILLIAGLGFKAAAVPFHMWAPDVYEGAPTPITALLAVGAKAAVFALILRLFGEALLPAIGEWQIIIAIIAAITMTFGNLMALTQRNIKRLFAYSSIGQVGYLLIGIAALANLKDSSILPSQLASSGLILHLIGYAVSNLAAFLCIITFYNATQKELIKDFAGLSKRAPLVSMIFTGSLFSLAGLPIFAGFTTKFYLFTAATNEGLLWLSSIAILNSVISLYYYLIIIRQMYIEEALDYNSIRPPLLTSATLVLLFSMIIIIGVYPRPLVAAINAAVKVIF